MTKADLIERMNVLEAELAALQRKMRAIDMIDHEAYRRSRQDWIEKASERSPLIQYQNRVDQ